MKTVLRENQLKFVDVEEMRAITNNRCIAEQIKNDKAESVVMNGVKTGKVGKLETELTRRCGVKVRGDCVSQS